MSAPNSQNVILGRGEVLIDVQDANGDLTGYVHLGNCSAFEITADVQEIELNSSMSGTSSTYASDVLKTTWNIRITGEEFHKERMAMLQMGDVGYLTQGSGTATGAALGTAAEAYKGRIIATGKRDITVTDVKQGVTTLTEGTDYEVWDAHAGLIHILDGFTGTEGSALTWDGSYAAISGSTLPVVHAGTATGGLKGKIKYISANPRGPQVEVDAWYASLRPDGAVSFIGDNYISASLVGKLNDDSAGSYGGSAACPTHQVIYRATKRGA